MLNTRWLIGLVLLLSTALPACSTRTSLGRESEDAGGKGADTWQDPRPATGCTYAPVSVDLGCNDDPNLPTVAGTCGFDGTCTCRPGFVLNPTSKRCKLDTTSDAGAVICTIGADQTCNDDLKMSMISGTCVGGVACACRTGYFLNPATGKCRFVPETDAGVSVGVCTFLLDQTCNDDDLYSGTAGVCQKGFTCSCNSGFAINPATGRCRAVEKLDAAVVPDTWVGKDTGVEPVDAPVGKDTGKDTAGVCTFGMDQTCNHDGWASWVAGTCQSDGTCVCGSGYVMNPSSGRCAYLPKDAGPDLTDSKTVCTPGMNQTCNEDPSVPYIWGSCQPSGVCLCNNGTVLNPSTGKCKLPEVSTCSGSYDACGCGCCGTPPAACYYPSAGDSVSAIKAADESVKSSTNCNLVGCAQGQHYVCCAEAAAEPAGSAQYSLTYTPGGYDRITLQKTGNDGNCLSAGLISPVPTGTGKTFRVSTPTNWGLQNLSFANGCVTSTSELAIGAQGTITLTPSGSACGLNAHMTVFFYAAATGTVSTRRIDADNIPGMAAGYCK